MSDNSRNFCYHFGNFSLVPKLVIYYKLEMRILARNTLAAFWTAHPETKASLSRWYEIASAASWSSANDIRQSFPKAVGLNGERVKFEVAGGNYRMIVAFNYRLQIAFIKFLGSHAEYDKIDPFTVSMF